MPRCETADIAVRDGTRLATRVWRADHPRAAVLLHHGLGEHSGRYEVLAQQLTAARISVYAFDMRGHGRSPGPRGHIDRFQHWLEDVDDLKDRWIIPAIPAVPLSLLGHSLGGLVVLAAALRHPEGWASVVALSPAVVLRVRVPAFKALIVRWLTKSWPRLALPNGLVPATLSHDPAVVTAYCEDPLIHRQITLRAFQEMQAAMAYVKQGVMQLPLPTLVLAAGADAIVDTEAVQQIAMQLGGEHRVRVFADAYHELHHEAVRETVFEDICHWVLSHPAPWIGAMPS